MDLVNNVAHEPENESDKKSEITINNVTWNDIKFLKGEVNQLELDNTNQTDYACLISYDAQFENKYTYEARWLHFPDAIVEDANGETITIIYQMSLEDRSEVQRFARCTIPASEEAIQFTQDKLQITDSDGNESNMQNSSNDTVLECTKVIQTTMLYQVDGTWYVSEGYICYGQGYDNDPSPLWPPDNPLPSPDPLPESGGGNWNNSGNEDPDPCNDPNALLLPASCTDIPDVPCVGNPVKNPRIAPQSKSGINGGRFGYTRSNGNQLHSGLDVANDIGDPIYAMYGGTVVSVDYVSDDLGYYVTVQSFVNGEFYTHQYGHLQESGRPSKGSQVIAGQLIGVQGLSGNLGNAIDRGYTIPHTHIIVRKRIGTGWHLEKDYSGPINPEQILTTQFDHQGNPISSTDC